MRESNEQHKYFPWGVQTLHAGTLALNQTDCVEKYYFPDAFSQPTIENLFICLPFVQGHAGTFYCKQSFSCLLLFPSFSCFTLSSHPFSSFLCFALPTSSSFVFPPSFFLLLSSLPHSSSFPLPFSHLSSASFLLHLSLFFLILLHSSSFL